MIAKIERSVDVAISLRTTALGVAAILAQNVWPLSQRDLAVEPYDPNYSTTRQQVDQAQRGYGFVKICVDKFYIFFTLLHQVTGPCLFLFSCRILFSFRAISFRAIDKAVD